MDKKRTLFTILKLGYIVSSVSYFTYQGISKLLFKRLFESKSTNENINEDILYFINSSKTKSICVKSFDGYLLAGKLIENHDNNDYLIMLHGTNKNMTSMYEKAMSFDKLGYNILLIDLRSLGKSEGNYFTYGLKESFDLVEWISCLISRNKDVNIYLYGCESGAFTCLLSLANKLPVNVKGVIEDSSFASLKEELQHTITKEFKLKNNKYILELFEDMMKQNFGFCYEDFNLRRILRNNEIPVLFIHNKNNETVPYDNALILYNNNKGYKKIYPLYEENDKNYFINIDNFIKNLKN